MWQRHPGSRDMVFNDLMLWGYIRRFRARRGLLRNAERLGLQTGTVHGRHLSIEEQTRMLKKLAFSLESGDPYTHGHSQRVGRHAFMIAKAMRLPRAAQEKVRLAGALHDVGKLRIPVDILHKAGPLTTDEYELIKAHAETGARMVSLLTDRELTEMVRQHHERLDGSGYPSNLPANEISIGARILAVADTFDAASSQRPYRDAQPHKIAIDILKKDAGTRLDRAAVDAFLSYYSGRRSVRWWAMAWSAPMQLHDAAFFVLQRLGTVGIANAAVVGVAAAALAPGSFMHPHHGTINSQLERDGQRGSVQRLAETQNSDTNAPSPEEAPDTSVVAPPGRGKGGGHSGSHDPGRHRGKGGKARILGNGVARGGGAHGHGSHGDDPSDPAPNGNEPGGGSNNGHGPAGQGAEGSGSSGDPSKGKSGSHRNQSHGKSASGTNSGNGQGKGGGVTSPPPGDGSGSTPPSNEVPPPGENPGSNDPLGNSDNSHGNNPNGNGAPGSNGNSDNAPGHSK
jgi:hypothetical protein